VIISLVLLVLVLYLLLNKNSDIETVRVAVANKDIYSQEVITKEMISFQTFIKDYQPLNGISESEALSLIGNKIYLPAKKGDILNASFFGNSKDGLSGGIANFIPSGKKLVYIKSDDVHTFPDDLQKENSIDIIAVNQKDETGKVQIIAENVKIFDVIRNKESDTNEITKAGLILNDNEVLKLSSVFTQDWKLNIAIHPQNEKTILDNTLQKVASDEASNVTPTPNEKKVVR
jgi:Flp pilus assembly protein CpaB